jgi:VIT1/CCC1 family predicted Fe2+/Mn2+ transporter
MQLEKHYITRIGWLRAAVLGANDGILSTTSLAIGVAAASDTRNPVILAALAGLVAGAMSMAAGEYISVSSQSDIETADLKREKKELDTMPVIELKELAEIYEQRGLSKDLSLQVAKELTKRNALEAHARDELGINEITTARPMQAALASAASFVSGGILPLIVSLFVPLKQMVISQYALAIVALAILGAVSARTGGAPLGKAVIRICFWGTVAMGITAVVGYLFGVKTS